jgi:excisionase family DNA binding protein
MTLSTGREQQGNPRRAPLVGVAEIASYLRVKAGWVYKHKHRLPHMKIGKYLRFDMDEVADAVGKYRNSAA